VGRGEHAGFSTATPWIAVHPNHSEVNVAAQLDDPNSVWHHYRQLIALRHNDPVVMHGTFAMLAADHEQLYAFTRTTDDDLLLVMANLSSDPLPLAGTELADRAGELVLGNYPDTGPTQVLRPWEALVLRVQGRRSAAEAAVAGGVVPKRS